MLAVSHLTVYYLIPYHAYRYYQRQLQLDEADWSALEACLRTPLPVTFRFSGQGELALAGRATMEASSLLSLVHHFHVHLSAACSIYDSGRNVRGLGVVTRRIH